MFTIINKGTTNLSFFTSDIFPWIYILSTSNLNVLRKYKQNILKIIHFVQSVDSCALQSQCMKLHIIVISIMFPLFVSTLFCVLSFIYSDIFIGTDQLIVGQSMMWRIQLLPVKKCAHIRLRLPLNLN